VFGFHEHGVVGVGDNFGDGAEWCAFGDDADVVAVVAGVDGRCGSYDVGDFFSFCAHDVLHWRGVAEFW